MRQPVPTLRRPGQGPGRHPPGRLCSVLGACCAALLAPLAAQAACGDTLDPRQRRIIERPTHHLAFAALPAPLAVGRHFGIDIVVCPQGQATAPVALLVDADMPAHRHGMNYRATVRKLDNGRWRADGLLLHMPGRWRLVFDLSADGRIERLTHEFELP